MLDAVGYVVLGIILIMAPGFLFSLVLYPRLSDFDFWVRMGVSLALGALVISFIGIGVAKAGALGLPAFVGVDLALCATFLVVAFFRGGFEVITTYARGALRYARGALRYARAVPRLFRKIKPLKPSKPPMPQPEQPKEQPPKKSEGT